MSFKLPPPPGINKFDSASWQDWFFRLRTALSQAFNSISAISGVPLGGATNEVLTKLSSTDLDTGWLPIPPIVGLPPGGIASDVLTKLSSTDGDASWLPIPPPTIAGLPTGGATNEVLTKISSTDWDASWLPAPTTDLVSPGNNIVHNSYFQERDYTSQSDVIFATTAPYTQHARRWYGVAPSTDFKTLINNSHDSTRITIKRTAGTDTGAVRLVQILDTEDSIKFSGAEKTLWIYFSLQTGANVTSVTFKVSTGAGIDESLANYLTGSWTSQTQILAETAVGGYNLTFGSTISQIAFEIEVIFDSTASATDDEVFINGMFVTDQGLASPSLGTMICSKSRAVIRQECNRYYQQMDLYLTTSEINVPIHMRDIPTVTLGDAAAFTTTGTTADTLVIKVDSAGDNGIHTVYLNCEL